MKVVKILPYCKLKKGMFKVELIYGVINIMYN